MAEGFLRISVLRVVLPWILSPGIAILPISQPCGVIISTIPLNEPTYMIEELKETRAIMADYPQIADLPLHITEFNSSYVPVCPVHEYRFSCRLYCPDSQWSRRICWFLFLLDLQCVFEEQDVPKAVFHGGFGLVALNSIKKPTFYAFGGVFLQGRKELLYRDDNLLVTRDEDRYVIIGWNWERKKGKWYSQKL